MHADLLLVCHASTAAVRSASFPADDPLDEKGTTAAAAATFVLGPERVRCAPSRAARQTAAALGFTLDPVDEPKIRDCDFGRWSGRPMGDVAREEPEAFGSWITDAASRPHGGESLADLLARVGEWVDSCRTLQGTTVAVTHPAVIRAAIVHAIDAAPASFWHIDIGPLSRTWLRSNGTRWTLRSLWD
jgi:broad specificity phosphatase PhoE